MDALKSSDGCVMVMPCGPSASMEMGWAAGAGRKVIVYIPGMREPDLMVLMADHVTDSMDYVLGFFDGCANVNVEPATPAGATEPGEASIRLWTSSVHWYQMGDTSTLPRDGLVIDLPPEHPCGLCGLPLADSIHVKRY